MPGVRVRREVTSLCDFAFPLIPARHGCGAGRHPSGTFSSAEGEETSFCEPTSKHAGAPCKPRCAPDFALVEAPVPTLPEIGYNGF